jgi:hypothetical protein
MFEELFELLGSPDNPPQPSYYKGEGVEPPPL